MSFRSYYKVMPELPILLMSFSEGDFDQHESLNQMEALLDQQPAPVFYMIDTSNLHLSIDEMLRVNKEFVMDHHILSHPNIRETIIITTDEMYEVAAKGLNSAIFGFIKIKVFPSIDTALDYVRTQIREGQPTSK